MKNIILHLFLLFIIALSFQNSLASQYYYGKVSNVDIYCYLNQDNAKISGKLFYAKVRTEIVINGIINESKISFSEYIDNKITGTYEGIIYHQDSIAGIWSSPAGKKLKFYLVKATEDNYKTGLEKKDINSITDPGLKKLLTGIKEQTLPFTFKGKESEVEIDSNLVNIYLKADNGFVNWGTYYYDGYVFYKPEYVGFIMFRFYEPGAFGIHNEFIHCYTYTYSGKLISTATIGCNCYDTNMGNNDYYSTEEVVEVFSDKIIVSSTNTHATLIEEEGEESISEVTTDRSVYEISDAGILSVKEFK